LATMTSLQTVSLIGTLVTDEGTAELKKALPGANISN